jgi:hypothetical protein
VKVQAAEARKYFDVNKIIQNAAVTSIVGKPARDDHERTYETEMGSGMASAVMSKTNVVDVTIRSPGGEREVNMNRFLEIRERSRMGAAPDKASVC